MSSYGIVSELLKWKHWFLHSPFILIKIRFTESCVSWVALVHFWMHSWTFFEDGKMHSLPEKLPCGNIFLKWENLLGGISSCNGEPILDCAISLNADFGLRHLAQRLGGWARRNHNDRNGFIGRVECLFAHGDHGCWVGIRCLTNAVGKCEGTKGGRHVHFKHI